MIKYSEKFMKGLDDALAWCDAEDKRNFKEGCQGELQDQNRFYKYHIKTRRKNCNRIMQMAPLRRCNALALVQSPGNKL